MIKENEYKWINVVVLAVVSVFTIIVNFLKNSKHLEVDKSFFTILVLVIATILIVYFWWQLFFNVESIFYTTEKLIIFTTITSLLEIVIIYLLKEWMFIIPIVISLILYTISQFIVNNLKNKEAIKVIVKECEGKKYVNGGIRVTNYTYYRYELQELNGDKNFVIKNSTIKLEKGNIISGKYFYNRIIWDFRNK